MTLLIFTQKIDKEDAVLGFFHNWLQKLSPKFDSIFVICLQKGSHDLPPNVKVFSLGKEERKSKISYIFNFYKYIFKLWGKYDAVFVHMNQEYVLLGGVFWKIFGKKVYIWRNHKDGNFLTKIAIWLSDKVFYTSPESFTAKFSKSIKMPVGIDTDKFKFQTPNSKSQTKNKILSLGRISPIKNVHLILEAAKKLNDLGANFKLSIVGNPANPEDFEYKERLEKEGKELMDKGVVSFLPAVPNYETPKLYQSHEVFINLTPPGSFDKTVLEAAASGCVPFVNMHISKEFDEISIPLDPSKIASRLEDWFNTPDERKEEIRKTLSNFVHQKHSLSSLTEELTNQIQ